MRQPVQQLIQLYQNNLFTAAFNICQNQMDAEDAVQETFVQYYTSRKEFENEQHIRAWLLRVVINKAKNINRTFWKKNKMLSGGLYGNSFFSRFPVKRFV